MNSELAKLKPCPFCGGEAAIERKGTARASMIIACQDCGCRVESGDVYGMTKPEQYQWNRRAALSGEGFVCDAMHASAPSEHKCADCTMGAEPCADCYAVYWRRKNPNTVQVDVASAIEASFRVGLRADGEIVRLTVSQGNSQIRLTDEQANALITQIQSRLAAAALPLAPVDNSNESSCPEKSDNSSA